MSARWQNGRSPLHIFPRSNNNLAAIHQQKCLRCSSGIQVGGCKTLVEPQTEEGHFEKEGPRHHGRLAGLAPATDPETAPSPCGLGHSPIWPWSCHQHHPLRDLEGAILPMPWLTGPPISILAVDPEAAPSPSQPRLRSSPAGSGT